MMVSKEILYNYRFITIFVVLGAFDIFSKVIANNNLLFGQSTETFIPFIKLLLIYNSGIAFGIFDDRGDLASNLLLILTILIIVNFLKYKSLLPLLWIILIIDILFRFVSGSIHPLTEEYYSAVPPGRLSQVPLLAYGTLMFFLSIRNND